MFKIVGAAMALMVLCTSIPVAAKVLIVAVKDSATGSPLSDVQILAKQTYNEGVYGNVNYTSLDTSDAGGVVSVQIAPNSAFTKTLMHIYVIAVRNGYGATPSSVLATPQMFVNDTLRVAIRLYPLSYESISTGIKGTVITAGAKPVSGARVNLMETESNQVQCSGPYDQGPCYRVKGPTYDYWARMEVKNQLRSWQITDSLGRFALPADANTKYLLTTEAFDGYASSSFGIGTIAPGQLMVITCPLKKGIVSISGTVTDSSTHAPLADAQVILRQLVFSPSDTSEIIGFYPRDTVLTNAVGAFVFDTVLAETRYTLTFWKTDYLEGTIQIRSGEINQWPLTFNHTLSSGIGRIAGTVIDSMTQKFADSAVVFLKVRNVKIVGGRPMPVDSTIDSTTVSPQGVYSFTNVDVGIGYLLSAWAPCFFQSKNQAATIAADQTTLVDFQLVMHTGIDGWVTDTTSYENVGNAIVILYKKKITPGSPFPVITYRPIDTVMSDIGGYYTFPASAVYGTLYDYRLTALASGYSNGYADGVVVEDSLITTANISMAPDLTSAVHSGPAHCPAINQLDIVCRADAGGYRIGFSLPTADNIALDIYDLRGTLLAHLADGFLTAGRHILAWAPNDHAGNYPTNGLYFIRLTTSQGSRMQQIMLFR